MSMTELLTMIGIENVTKAVTALLIFISVCAILTSLVTEGLKCVEKIDSLPNDAVIKLTKAGVDLAEGTIEDAGVDI